MPQKNFLKIFIFLTIFFVITNNVFALSLDEYLDQTQKQSLASASSNLEAEGSAALKKRAFLLTTPNFFASAKSGFVEQNQPLQVFRYSQINTQNYAVGIEDNTSFGLNTKLYYNVNRTAYEDLNSTVGSPINYQTNPVLTLSFPLWKGRFGKLTKANQNLTYFSSETTELNARYSSASFLVASEKAYWSLVTARRIVEIQKNSLKRSEDILEYVNKRNKMNLGERSDVLQARASLETIRLELKRAENQERIASRLFNQQRFLDTDSVQEKLSDIDFNTLEKMPINKNRSNSRYDVKAAQAVAKAAVANAKIEEENNKPSLDLSGSYGYSGLESGRKSAISNSLQSNGENGYVGINFSMPIAIGLTSEIRGGAKKAASAAKINYRQKLFEEENDWNNLVQNLEDYQENLKLSRQIESAQKAKLENEKKLLKQGRTSTYQILLFEQDYDRARLTTVQNAYNLLSLMADKKLYE